MIVNGLNQGSDDAPNDLNRNFNRSLMTEDRLNQIMLGGGAQLNFGNKLQQTQSIVEKRC